MQGGCWVLLGGCSDCEEIEILKVQQPLGTRDGCSRDDLPAEVMPRAMKRQADCTCLLYPSKSTVHYTS